MMSHINIYNMLSNLYHLVLAKLLRTRYVNAKLRR